MATVVDNSQTNGTEDDRELYKIPCGSTAISINLSFVKSLFGICKAVLIVVSLIGLICIGAGANLACDYAYGGNYGFFEFVAVTVFINDLILYIIFAISIEEMWCLKFLPWLEWHFIESVIFALLYFIAAIVVAAHTCGRSGYEAAAVFGFMGWIAEVVTAIVSLLRIRREHAPTENRFLLFLGAPRSENVGSRTPEYDPETTTVDPKY